MLSGDSRTKLHKVFSYAMLTQEYLDNIAFDFFSCCQEPFGQQCIGFLPVKCCSKSVKANLHRTFFIACCLEPLRQYCIGFELRNVVLRLLRQTGFFLEQSFLQPLIQHCIRVSTCAMLSQE